MKKRIKNILSVIGVIFEVIGILGAIPFFLKEMYIIAGFFSFLVIVGLIFLALAFSE